MSVPLWALLGFAAWTLLLLLFTVGIYRWSRILTGRAAIASFGADPVEGRQWYLRAMRAHANCVENLPVFATIVLVAHVSGTTGATMSAWSAVILGARILQSIIHVAFTQTNPVVAARFLFFFLQVIGFIVLTASVLAAHWPW